MKCYSCKATIPDDATFCPTCGKPQGFDARTIRAASRGDQAALTELYEKTYSSVYNTIKFLVRNEDAALDILQDSYVKAFRSLDMLQDPSRFGAWMRRIAHNRAVDYLRQTKPVSLSSLTADESGEEVELVDDRTDNLPDVVIDQQETARLLNEILDALPDDQRVCVTLYYYEQLSVHEIAEELDVPEATVKSRLMYGRKKIEQQVKALERRGTKLYGVAPIALLMWLFQNEQAQAAVLPSAAALQATLASVAASAEASAAATGGTAAASTTTAGGANAAGGSATAAAGSAAGAGAAAAAASGSIVTKAVAAAVAIALAAGGGALAARAFSAPPEPSEPIAVPVTPEAQLYDEIMSHYVDRLSAVPSDFLAWYDEGHDHGYSYSERINNELIAELFRTGAKLWYGKIDINGDGIEELLLGTAGDGWTQCWDAFTVHAGAAIPLFTDENVLEYRKNLYVLPDGTLDLHGSGGIDAGTDTYYRIIDGGFGLEPVNPPLDTSGAVDALSWRGVKLREIPYTPGEKIEDTPSLEETQSTGTSGSAGATVSTDGIFDAYLEVLRAYEISMNADPASDPIYGTYDWARTWIDTRGEGASVEHAEVDLNGDGVPEMVMASYVNYGSGWEEWYPFEIYTYDGKNAIALFVGQITTADWLHFATDGTMWITQGNADPTPVRRWELPAGGTELNEIASAGSEDELPHFSYASILRPPAV